MALIVVRGGLVDEYLIMNEILSCLSLSLSLLITRLDPLRASEAAYTIYKLFSNGYRIAETSEPQTTTNSVTSEAVSTSQQNNVLSSTSPLMQGIYCLNLTSRLCYLSVNPITLQSVDER